MFRKILISLQAKAEKKKLKIKSRPTEPTAQFYTWLDPQSQRYTLLKLSSWVGEDRTLKLKVI